MIREGLKNLAAGANPVILKKGIKKAFELQMAGKGFTFIELLTNCPTNWGMSPLDNRSELARYEQLTYLQNILLSETTINGGMVIVLKQIGYDATALSQFVSEICKNDEGMILIDEE